MNPSAVREGLTSITDAEIRLRHLFQGDRTTYRLAKKASDEYEHSFEPLWKVRDKALKALELAAGYLRQSILQYSGLDEEIQMILLHDYFKLPYNSFVQSSIRGELLGTGNALDQLASFPDIDWETEVYQLGVDEEQDATLGFRTRIAVRRNRLPDGFKMAELAVVNRVAEYD